MSAGMMPTLDFPGLMRPGQLGPMSRTPFSCASAKNSAVSATGTPSVMMTTSGTPASIASTTAALVWAGGTKITETSAPVFSTASATVPKTGTSISPKATEVPALRGFTPPTTDVPDASMRVVCFWPSEPVMPWTMTLDASVRKIAMVVSASLCVRGSGRGVGELGRLVGAAVHRVRDRDQGVGGVGEDPSTLEHVVAVQAHDEGLRGLVAQDLQGRHDSVGDGVARRDAAEDVDEDRLDLRVR